MKKLECRGKERGYRNKYLFLRIKNIFMYMYVNILFLFYFDFKYVDSFKLVLMFGLFIFLDYLF